MNNILDELCSRDLLSHVEGVSNVSAIRKIFLKQDLISIIRENIKISVVTFEDISEWVSEKLDCLQRGVSFPHDLSFAALSVVLEQVPVNDAGLYLNDLANLNIQEMPVSRHVAEISLEFRNQFIASNSVRKFKSDTNIIIPAGVLKVSGTRVNVTISKRETYYNEAA